MALPKSVEEIDSDALERFREIIKVPITWANEKEEAGCKAIVDAMSEEQIQQAANISYAYWVLQLRKDAEATVDVARKIAMKVARWHFKYVNGNVDSALKRFQEALEIRKERKLDLLRTCFDSDVTSEDALAMRKNVSSDLEKQLQVLRGQDKAGRAIVIKLPRQQGGTTEEAYVQHQLYVAERSAAVTEYISKGKFDSATALFSMQNQNSSVTPPMAWQLSTIKLLQKLVPGRMELVIILEAPFLIRQLFNIIRPFLSASLKESTHLVAGKAKIAKLQEVMDDYDYLTDDGELVRPVDVQKYLNDVPFYLPYDHES